MDTLAHRVIDPNDDYDAIVSEVNMAGDIVSTLIKIRYDAKRMLAELAQTHEIVVYESASAQFVNQIAMALDPDFEIFSVCLSNDSCVPIISDGRFQKDLRVLLGRDLKQISYVSSKFDIPYSQLHCFVPIIPSSIASGFQNSDSSSLFVDYMNKKEEFETKDSFGFNHFTGNSEVTKAQVMEFFNII